jgi:predicted GH43/DUF377 family glycosyl hydrolase
MKYFFFFFWLIFATKLCAFIDLDKMQQPFVLETKQIHIPGYPDAFNPSIVCLNDHVLMTFRSRKPGTNSATLVGFVWLDKDFNLISKPELLHITEGDVPSFYIQDPRLCVINNKLYMLYSDLWEDPESKIKKRKMFVSGIEHDGIHFWTSFRESFLDFDGDRDNKFEKNWVPFDYQGIMLLSYSLSPHKIFSPLNGEKKCISVSYNNQRFNPWHWGILRGGTPALLVDNYYLAFFHSSIKMSSVQSNGESMPHYFMGAYLFETHPPFSIKKISPKPIVSKAFYSGEPHQTWKPLRVVFPCGFIHDDKHIWVSYGRQDHECWIVKLDKAGLLKSLIPFPSKDSK